MNLESNQHQHNLAKELFARLSASNDSSQIVHDAHAVLNNANETLIQGAKLVSEGRSMGLNDDQTIYLAELANQSEVNAFGTSKELPMKSSESNNSIQQEISRRNSKK